jgi:hypothetical protein
MTLFVWYLLALLHTHPVCTYWTDAAPTRDQLMAAGCGDYLYYMDNRQYYIDITGWDYQNSFYTVQDASGPTTLYQRMENEVLCVVTVAHPGEPTPAELWDKCSYRWDLLQSHDIRGWELYETRSVDLEPACTLPLVNNSGDLTTHDPLDFLAGRLTWWGIDSTADDWQNRFDDSLRGASDAAGVPAYLLKAMLKVESQYWPLWTGDAGEQGWLQVTWDGADTALRHSPDLYARYCPQAMRPARCTVGYALLTSDEKLRTQAVLLADLAVEGTPLEASTQAANDLWIYANILRAYACYAQALYPAAPDVWTTAAVLYNAGPGCLSAEGTVCEQGKKYLEMLK